MKATYTGTFDPITNGHVDVITRSARLFNELVVAVASNPSKNPVFTLAERIVLAQEALKHLPNVTVQGFDGLVVEFAREVGAGVLVRGVRSVGDFDYERQMAMMNRKLAPAIDSIMLTPAPELAYISSSLVREIARLGGDIESLVPPNVAKAINAKLKSEG